MEQRDPIDLPKGLTRLVDCRLVHTSANWSYARRHADRIAAHWLRRQAENPSFFNGRILMTLAAEVSDGVLTGAAATVDFADFLYWREQGFDDPTVCDVFGSALIMSADGALMLARQRAGNLNADSVYPPGGLLDPRDIGPDGRIDIGASISREVREETSLSVGDLTRDPGFLLACNGPQAAVGAVFRSPLERCDLADRMMRGLENDP